MQEVAITSDPTTQQPHGALLDGVRVVDLSRVLAGPYAAQLLAEMGADVVKVEPPDGDPARGIGPHIDGRSLYFSSLNSGKRGIVLDLAAPAHRHALDLLLATADIVVENFRASTVAKLGCEPAALLERHPHLTVVTVSGYARDSDRAQDPAFDLSVQAESGIMSLTGEPGGSPMRAGVPIGDLTAGMQAALAAVAGHVARLRDGHGRHVEVPLLDAAISQLSYVATAAAAQGTDPPPVGSHHHVIVPYGAYPTSDGWIAVAVIGDKFWGLLCDALELDLGSRRDLATNVGRHAARAEVDAAVATGLRAMTTAEAQALLGRWGVPNAPVNGVLAALDTPYVATRGAVADIATPEGGYRLVQSPLRSGRALRPAPAQGEHTAEVLGEVLAGDAALLAEIVGA